MLTAQILAVCLVPLVFGAVAVVVVLRADRKDIPEIVRWIFPWNRR